MDPKLNYNAISSLNSLPQLYKSMKSFSMDNCLDTTKMLFVPFSARDLNLSMDEQIFFKKEELTTVQTLFTKAIMEVQLARLSNKIDTDVVISIIDQIEAQMLDVKHHLEKFSEKMPALANSIQQFVKQHKENMSTANKLFSEIPEAIPPHQLHESRAYEKLAQTILWDELSQSSIELDESLHLLKWQLNSCQEAYHEAANYHQKLNTERDTLSLKLQIHNSTLKASRNDIKKEMGLDVNFLISDEDLLEYVEEQINDNGSNASLTNLIIEIKTSLDLQEQFKSILQSFQLQSIKLHDLEAARKDIKQQFQAKELELQTVGKKIQEISGKI